MMSSPGVDPGPNPEVKRLRRDNRALRDSNAELVRINDGLRQQVADLMVEHEAAATALNEYHADNKRLSEDNQTLSVWHRTAAEERDEARGKLKHRDYQVAGLKGRNQKLKGTVNALGRKCAVAKSILREAHRKGSLIGLRKVAAPKRDGSR